MSWQPKERCLCLRQVNTRGLEVRRDTVRVPAYGIIFTANGIIENKYSKHFSASSLNSIFMGAVHNIPKSGDQLQEFTVKYMRHGVYFAFLNEAHSYEIHFIHRDVQPTILPTKSYSTASICI